MWTSDVHESGLDQQAIVVMAFAVCSCLARAQPTIRVALTGCAREVVGNVPSVPGFSVPGFSLYCWRRFLAAFWIGVSPVSPRILVTAFTPLNLNSSLNSGLSRLSPNFPRLVVPNSTIKPYREGSSQALATLAKLPLLAMLY